MSCQFILDIFVLRLCVCVQQGQARSSQVLVLGLDGTGKTSLLQYFVTGSVEQEVSPTQGFHAISINREKLHIEFLESTHTTYTHYMTQDCSFML